MPRSYQFELDDILKILPHRPPFLFVDRVTKMVPDKRIVTERLIRPDEPQFEGHFPGKPIMPGVLVTDALAQTSGLLWGFTKQVRAGEVSEDPELFYLAVANVKFTSPAYPGELLEMRANNDNRFGSLYSYSVEAVVEKRTVAKGSLTLAMVEGEL
jgi:3-hydroxymyristoyl/3-hydroxydecanoyl-(acyl carrier protein) dehydratase